MNEKHSTEMRTTDDEMPEKNYVEDEATWERKAGCPAIRTHVQVQVQVQVEGQVEGQV